VLTLEGDGLRASVLEPGVDDARLGSRYVAGGYLWQVTDERHGALCAGPAFPAENPPVFDGQGLPEVFETALGAGDAEVGDEVYVIGVGRVRRDSAVRPFHVRDNPTVTERAVWQVTATTTRIEAESHAAFGDFRFALLREVALEGRTLVSATHVRNSGVHAVPLRWFAHPFFPWAGDETCRLSLESALPDGAALVETASGFFARRAGVDWQSGHYLVPRVTLGAPLVVEQRHPALGTLRVECRFPLGGLALWGNARTFSVEPFFQTIVPPGGEVGWSVAYDFSPPR
jgi:hypothetical protein